MRVGVDWFSLVLVVAAYFLVRVRSLSLRMRYTGLAVLFAVMALARLRLGTDGFNGVLTLVVAGLALYYASRAVRAGR